MVSPIGMCFLSLVAMNVAFPTSDLEEWLAFKKEHGKHYSRKEDTKRMKLFLSSKKQVEDHNKLFDDGEVSYKKGVNKYSDLTEDEMRRRTFTPGLLSAVEFGSIYNPPAKGPLPAAVDWRRKGAVTPVKDQWYYGGCWAFSAVGSVEGQHFLKTGKLVSLSEQNLIDCSDNKKWISEGGLLFLAFNYIVDNGISTESSYPYEEKMGQCRSGEPGATISGYVRLPVGNETALQYAVANVGPVSVCIDAEASFFQYRSGIYFGQDCTTPFFATHCVLIVGYGSDEGQDFWIVKNSAGLGYGEEGYIRMSRNRSNNCNIAIAAFYPIV